MNDSLRLGKMLEHLQTENGYNEMKQYLCDVMADAIGLIAETDHDDRKFEILVALRGYKNLIDELAETPNPYPDVKPIVDM